MRLDQWLTEHSEVSRSCWQRRIKEGHVRVNQNVIVSPKHDVSEADQIEVEPLPATQAQPENIPLDIQFEDEHLIVVHKPAGMVVHPAVGHPSGTLVNALLYHTGLPRVGMVHRLDKDTSGLLVAAKTEAALAHLAAQFHPDTKQAERHYYALVQGVPKYMSGSIDQPIMRDPRNFEKMYIPKPADQHKARHAVTHYEVVSILGEADQPLAQRRAVLECVLETGRTHQIRVHLSHLGHPIIGDRLYGSRETWDRIGLHAFFLSFIHPKSEERMEFTLDCPAW